MSEASSIEGVILAAGTSSRFGAFKPALLIGGKAMISRCIEGMYDVCERIIVVGGNEIERLRTLVRGFDKVECIENASYQNGMFSSVKAGLAEVRGDRCLILPGDIPLVPPAVYRTLLAREADIVIPTFQKKRGHPICVSQSIIPRILAEPDSSSLREVITSMCYETVEVDAEEILVDVDTPQDHERIRERFR
jgi:molybdenum cofactor cytidylyltransferase